MKHKTWILLTVVLAVIVGCGVLWCFLNAAAPDREYLSDVAVPLADGSGEIVIREWRFLLGSGAEIYYIQNGKLTLLGTTTGGDDGYCPFADGKYTLAVQADTLLIRWYFGNDIWEEAHFSLPQK